MLNQSTAIDKYIYQQKSNFFKNNKFYAWNI